MIILNVLANILYVVYVIGC